MRTALLCAMISLTAADAPQDDAGAMDLKKMQGDWMVMSMVVNGMKMPDDEAQALFRTIKGDAYTVSRYSRSVSKGTFKIDATASPKSIDSLPSGAAPPAKPILGIYEFDGDSLRVCNAAPGKPRPTDFSSKLTSERTLIVWQPEK